MTENTSDQDKAKAAEAEKAKAAEAEKAKAAEAEKAKKKPAPRVAGRRSVTLEDCRRMGLDPAPYGLSAKKGKK